MTTNQMLFSTKNIKFDNNPFDHWLIEDFLDVEDARHVSKEFIDYDNPSEDIIHYRGWIGEKSTCNIWNRFPPLTYKVFSNLLSGDFVSQLSEITGISPLYPDIGLHGGGWHMSGKGGSLAMHLDLSLIHI